jgi:hypothetical protein
VTGYSPPAVPQFPAGFGPLPANFDAWVQAPFGFLTDLVVFRAERHASQSISATTYTPIQYDTILEDPFAGWAATVANAWTAPFTGWYEICVTAQVSTSSVVMSAGAQITGSVVYRLDQLSTPTMPGGVTTSYTSAMVGGSDYVQGIAWTSIAAALSATAGRYSSVEITFLSE